MNVAEKTRRWAALLGMTALAVMTGCAAGERGKQATAERERETIELPGVQRDGRVQLPNQWSLRPTGRQITIGDLPVNMAIHPEGRFAAILHAGFSDHEVIIVELTEKTAVVRSRVTLEATFYGLCFSKDGTRLYCSGGTKERVESFAFADGQLSDRKQLPVGPADAVGVPSGLALSADGATLYVAGNRGHNLTVLPVGGQAPPLQVKLPAESFPYGCIIDEAHSRLYVSLWGQAGVAVVNLPITASSAVAEIWPVQEHPNEMLLTRDGATLYVANANRNTVSAIDTATGRTREVISSALYADAPYGSTPNSMALSPDENTLYIANADNNNVAVIDVTSPGHGKSKGFIPVGWYPTSVRATPDGKRLLVANGKGTSPKANRHGPNPLRRNRSIEEYIAGLFRGTLSVIELPKKSEQWKALSATALACSPLRADQRPVVERPAGNPVPAEVGGASPIRYCVYIIKENRTYDQVLGDMPEGNGDPALCIFGEAVTPNHHAIAREFVLLDNFYAEAEVSADGHEWSMGAYATDFVEKNWPIDYGDRGFGRIGYPAEGVSGPISSPAEGYIWDRCAEAGVSYRSYGEFVSRNKGVLRAMAPALEGHFDPGYEPWNLDFPDQDRARRFIAELRRVEAEGDMPRLQILRLPNDHTTGTKAGKLTPTAMVADNDVALGMVIEAISRSKFWAETAVFVVEDDAQNGSDHVDAHRTIAFVASPYVRRGSVDHSLYSTASLLRTMELILGLRPMSQFDAAARPMYAAFGPRLNRRPYTCRPAQVDLAARNGDLAWGAAESEKLDLSREDAADDLVFNDIIWRSVRGADSPMPAPVRAAFVLTREDEDEEEEAEGQ